MAWDDMGGRGGRKPGGSGGFDKIPDIDLNKLKLPPFKPTYLAGAILGIIALWVILGGLYRVELQEQGLVIIFGEHVDTTGPGLHWNFPPPIGKVVKVGTEEIKRIEIGFRTERGVPARALKKESLMLTEGANMIDIHMSVQYQVKDPAQFIFGVADYYRDLNPRGPDQTVKNVAEAALREVVGKNTIDNILTVGKQLIQQEIHDLMMEILNRYKAGVTVRLVQLQDVHPPDEVRDSFRDVNNSEEDKNRLIREAEGYYNSVIPETRGEAAQIVANAEAYREEKVKHAEGEALRFEAQLAEYSKAPDITRKRLYIETMEKVLSNVDKVIVDEKVADKVLPLLPIGSGASVSVKGSNGEGKQ